MANRASRNFVTVRSPQWQDASGYLLGLQFDHMISKVQNGTADDARMIAECAHAWIAKGTAGNFWAAILEECRAIYKTRFLSSAPVAQPAPAAQPAPIAQPAPVVEQAPALSLKPGYYTVNLGDGTPTITLRVKDHWEKANSVVISYLHGSDNTSDYTGFAEITDGRFKVWRRFEGKVARQCRAATFLVTKDTSEFSLAYALESGRCARCGRMLTVEASIHRGFGPECASKIGA